MTNLQELTAKYGQPHGGFRRYLMKQESLTAVDQFTYLSKLEARLTLLVSESSVQESKDCLVLGLVNDLQVLCREIVQYKEQAITCVVDKNTFCESYDLLASIAETIESSIYENVRFLQKQTRLQKEPVKDRTKVRRAKDAWKKNKFKYKDAIKKFHQSSDGKAFHRNLSRFNKQRGESFSFGENDVLDVSKGLSSLLTHLLIEIQLVHSKQVESSVNTQAELLMYYRELYYIMNDLMTEMVESFFDLDKEVVSEVLEIVDEYYQLTE